MKAQATFQIVFQTTRDIEIDESDFDEWASKRYGVGYDEELAVAAWIDSQEAEYLTDVFSDWRIDRPLPADFELQYTEALDVTGLNRTKTGSP